MRATNGEIIAALRSAMSDVRVKKAPSEVNKKEEKRDKKGGEDIKTIEEKRRELIE